MSASMTCCTVIWCKTPARLADVTCVAGQLDWSQESGESGCTPSASSAMTMPHVKKAQIVSHRTRARDGKVRRERERGGRQHGAEGRSRRGKQRGSASPDEP